MRPPPRGAGYFAILSDVFLRLIKMIIAPLVFVDRGRRHRQAWAMRGGRAHRRQGAGWFITASLVSLMLGLVLVNLLQPGGDLALPLPDKDSATNVKTGGLGLREFIAHVFPASFVDAMASNEILQIVCFRCSSGCHGLVQPAAGRPR